MSNQPELPNDAAACQELILQLRRELSAERERAEQQQELASKQQQAIDESKQLIDKKQQLIDQQQQAVEQRQRLIEEQQRVLNATTVSHREVLAELESTRIEMERIREELRRARRWIFGQRSERSKDAPGQMLLFDLGEPVTGEIDLLLQTPVEPVQSRPRRNRRGRSLEDLPQRRIEHDLTDQEKVCSGCQREMDRIGTDESRVVQYTPAVLELEIHIRPKYACRCCQQGVFTKPAPVRPIPRSIAGPGLVSQVLVSKFGDHLPLYRQEDIFARHGLHLARSTLCDWVRGAAELLRPLAARLKSVVLESSVLWTDDTPVRVLDRDAESGTHRGHFWTYIGDSDHPYSVFDFTENRSSVGPVRFLNNYEGFVHADAYSGYDAVFRDSSGRIVEVACWAHTRRKFEACTKTNPQEAHQVLEWIRQLYDIEDRASSMTVGDRQSLRAQEASAILDRTEAWLDELQTAVLPKSSLGEAVTYARNQWQALRRYTEDGRLTIDNNISERTLRPQAVGRKNWLFLGNDEAGERAAIVYSIIASAKRHHVEPWAYLSDVLLNLHDSDDDLDRLLPDKWLTSHPECRLTHRVTESRTRQARKKAQRAKRRSCKRSSR